MRFGLFILLVCSLSNSAAAVPVAEGLLLHLDAASQNVLRQKAALPPLHTGQAVDLILDSSGAARHFTQPNQENRPLFLTDSKKAAFWRFDGENDFMAAGLWQRLSQNGTIFVMGAPQSNAGHFRAFFSANAAGQDDYKSGLNLDLGQESSAGLTVLNAEGAGASGVRDLLNPGQWTLAANLDFGAFHVFSLRSEMKPQGMEARIDGVPTGKRDRLESNHAWDECALGARRYSHENGVLPFVRDFFHGELAEVLVYERALSDAERDTVEQWLLNKQPAHNALLKNRAGHALEILADAPPLQMLVPGFSVEELPLQLANVNNLRYRYDSKLVALGYDGRIHLLSDTDGDGLEDTAKIFWDKNTLSGPLGMVVAPKDYPHGQGVLVASKGKISFIRDTNGDDVADEEIIVASGWKPIPQTVDAVGLALDPRDGSLYFGLGTANYANGYLINAKTGQAEYDIASDRGTIQRLAPDFSGRETICTGVRFTCALAFNAAGDLFATEQEGATWLPNGNALDELLHIQRGLHYGFPPRHPKHLPNVLDWPAVAEYGPQHQSAVGMVFNEGILGGPAFGPAHWNGNALVCGEARGKLYRTALTKTPHGYVGENHLIACLGLLTVDCCVTPTGDLLVACHSGPPDWGTGTKGAGRIFRIRYSGKELPQPVAAYAAAPGEFCVKFDRALPNGAWQGQEQMIRIEAGKSVSAGDRFETIRPGYQIVRNQMNEPRRDVSVEKVSLREQNSLLVLQVPPQDAKEGYAITLPYLENWAQNSPVAQKPTLDVCLTLNVPGPATGIVWSGERIVDASDPFVPKVQEGGKLDWEAKIDLAEVDEKAQILTIHQKTLPLSPERVWVPWAKDGKAAAEQPAHELRADWLLGQRVFFSAKAACYTCHQIRGQGYAVGPDLTNLTARDYPSVRHDILQPHATLNPDHVFTSVKTKDERLFLGILRRRDAEEVALMLQSGVLLRWKPSEVAEIQTQGTSYMPADYAERLTKEELEALIGYLLVNPLEAAPIERDHAPAARRWQDLTPAQQAALHPATEAAPKAPLLRLLLCAGPKDHGKGEHDYPLWQRRWQKLLNLAPGVSMKTHMGFPPADMLEKSDVTVFFSNNPGWSAANASLLDAYAARGGGLVYLHWAIEGGAAGQLLADRIGLATQRGKQIGYRHGPIQLELHSPRHPILEGFESPLRFEDETYWRLVPGATDISLLAEATEENAVYPQIWTRQYGAGRVLCSIPGHYNWTFDDPLYRLIVLRGICWAGKQETVDRLSELGTVGARLVW